MGNESGIYRIVNEVSGRTYIGSSFNIRRRFIGHRYSLNKGIHVNRHLQSAWNKYPSSSFKFEILLLCDSRDLEYREQSFIDAYLDHGMPLYNKKPSYGSRVGFKQQFTAEQLARLSASHKGKPWSEKRREAETPLVSARKSSALKGRPWSEKRRSALTDEARKKTSSLLVGRSISHETRMKISNALKGRQVSAESLAKRTKSRRLRMVSGVPADLAAAPFQVPPSAAACHPRSRPARPA